MSTGRTTWRAKPCGWRDRERVVALGEEFGPGGPLVLDVLEEMAKEQVGDGTVRAGLRSLARAAFLPRGSEGAELVRNVLGFAETVGALDDLAIADDADMTVTCRVSGFAADQGKGYESVRKARQRGAAAAETTEADAEVEGETDPDHVPEAGTEGDNVPDCPPTGQDRTGHSSLRSENARQRAVRFRGRQVSATTTALAVAVVERFNELAGTTYRPFGDDDRPSENLKRVLGAVLADRRITADVAEQMIRGALAGRRFWEPARPHLGHVFGPGVLEPNVENALRVATSPAGLSAGDRMALATQRRTEAAEQRLGAEAP